MDKKMTELYFVYKKVTSNMIYEKQIKLMKKDIMCKW